MRATSCSNASTSRPAHRAEIFTETYVTSGRRIRAQRASRRPAASSSPRIASPRRLTLRSNPAFVRVATWRAKAGSAAGMTTPRVSARMRRRTMAATGRGCRPGADGGQAEGDPVEAGERRREAPPDQLAELLHRPARRRGCAAPRRSGRTAGPGRRRRRGGGRGDRPAGARTGWCRPRTGSAARRRAPRPCRCRRSRPSAPLKPAGCVDGAHTVHAPQARGSRFAVPDADRRPVIQGRRAVCRGRPRRGRRRPPGGRAGPWHGHRRGGRGGPGAAAPPTSPPRPSPPGVRRGSWVGSATTPPGWPWSRRSPPSGSTCGSSGPGAPGASS